MRLMCCALNQKFVKQYIFLNKSINCILKPPNTLKYYLIASEILGGFKIMHELNIKLHVPTNTYIY